MSRTITRFLDSSGKSHVRIGTATRVVWFRVHVVCCDCSTNSRSRRRSLCWGGWPSGIRSLFGKSTARDTRLVPTATGIGWFTSLRRRVFEKTLFNRATSLEQIVGERVIAYRAPSFSITSKSLWALQILAEEGFTIDSSIYPIYHDRYGIPDAQPALHRLQTAAGALWEFPATVVRLAGMNWPVSGGGYFRLYPLAATIRALKTVNRRLSRPFVFYVHPWEVDADQPRLGAGSWLSRRRHYLNLHRTERKLRGLLAAFPFGRMRNVIDLAEPSRPSAEAIGTSH